VNGPEDLKESEGNENRIWGGIRLLVTEGWKKHRPWREGFGRPPVRKRSFPSSGGGQCFSMEGEESEKGPGQFFNKDCEHVTHKWDPNGFKLWDMSNGAENAMDSAQGKPARRCSGGKKSPFCKRTP